MDGMNCPFLYFIIPAYYGIVLKVTDMTVETR